MNDTWADGADRWLAEQRADEAAAARNRRFWAGRRAEEEATFSALLLDLAESGRPAAVRTTSGRLHRGVVVTATVPLCRLRTDAATVLLVTGTIASVREQATAPVRRGSRALPDGAGLMAALADLVEDQPDVALVVVGEPELLRGRLLAAGQDVVTVRVGGPAGTLVHVAAHAISEVELTGSG